MKKSEIRELLAEELREKVTEKEEEVANLKFQLALHQIDNTAKVKIAKRELATLKTIERERQLNIRTGKTSDVAAAQENA